MKKTLIALTLAAAIPVVYAAAGGDKYGHRDHGARLERMAVVLDLTEEQKTQVRTVFEEQRAERQALREQTRARLAEVLAPEQVEKMEQLRALRKEHRHGKRHHRAGCESKTEGPS